MCVTDKRVVYNRLVVENELHNLVEGHSQVRTRTQVAERVPSLEPWRKKPKMDKRSVRQEVRKHTVSMILVEE